MSILSWEDIRLRYPASQKDSLNLSVQMDLSTPHSILGGAGSGKTSMILTGSGLISHLRSVDLEGRVKLDGADLALYRPQTISRHIGIVPQDPTSLFIGQTVEQTVGIALQMRKMPLDKIRREITRVCEMVDVGHLIYRDLATLSGGEQQRVAIASAIAARPQVIFYDEAMTTLDPETYRHSRDLLKNLHLNEGLCAITASTRLSESLDSSTCHLLNGGSLIAHGQKRMSRRLIAQAYRHRIILPAALEMCVAMIERLESIYGYRLLADEDLFPEGYEQTISFIDRFLRIDPASMSMGLSKRSCDEPGEEIASIEGVTYRYPNAQQAAIEDCSFTLCSGQITAIIGSNGAGKSTLMATLNATIPPDRGRIVIGRRDISSSDIYQVSSLVGTVLQNPDHQLFCRTVEEELAYGLQRYCLSREQIATRIDEVLDLFDLSSVRGVNPLVLSASQRRRLAMGTALMIPGRRLICFDEPTAGLDAYDSLTVMNAISACAKRGMAIVMITHDLDCAARYADQIVHLEGGKIVELGSSRHILSTEMGRIYQHYGGDNVSASPLEIGQALADCGVRREI